MKKFTLEFYSTEEKKPKILKECLVVWLGNIQSNTYISYPDGTGQIKWKANIESPKPCYAPYNEFSHWAYLPQLKPLELITD